MRDYGCISRFSLVNMVAGSIALFEDGMIELKPLSRKEAEQRYPNPTEHYAHTEGRKYRRGKKHRMKGLRP